MRVCGSDIFFLSYPTSKSPTNPVGTTFTVYPETLHVSPPTGVPQGSKPPSPLPGLEPLPPSGCLGFRPCLSSVYSLNSSWNILYKCKLHHVTPLPKTLQAASSPSLYRSWPWQWRQWPYTCGLSPLFPDMASHCFLLCRYFTCVRCWPCFPPYTRQLPPFVSAGPVTRSPPLPSRPHDHSLNFFWSFCKCHLMEPSLTSLLKVTNPPSLTLFSSIMWHTVYCYFLFVYFILKCRLYADRVFRQCAQTVLDQ